MYIRVYPKLVKLCLRAWKDRYIKKWWYVASKLQSFLPICLKLQSFRSNCYQPEVALAFINSPRPSRPVALARSSHGVSLSMPQASKSIVPSSRCKIASSSRSFVDEGVSLYCCQKTSHCSKCEGRWGFCFAVLALLCCACFLPALRGRSFRTMRRLLAAI